MRRQDGVTAAIDEAEHRRRATPAETDATGKENAAFSHRG